VVIVELNQFLAQTFLGLPAETVVDPSQDDEESVADVRRLGDQRRIVRRLPALNVANNESLGVDTPQTRRLHEREDLRGRCVDRAHGFLWPFLVLEKVAS